MNIDLGKKCSEPICCPVPSSSGDCDKVYYPSLYLEGSSDLKSLPESGELTIRFRRVTFTTSERDGKQKISLELEVRAITGAKSGDADKEKSGEDALDELKDSIED
jgi:hypothetical protein